MQSMSCDYRLPVGEACAQQCTRSTYSGQNPSQQCAKAMCWGVLLFESSNYGENMERLLFESSNYGENMERLLFESSNYREKMERLLFESQVGRLLNFGRDSPPPVEVGRRPLGGGGG